MLTINKMINQVYELLSENTDDTRLPSRLLIDFIEQSRAVFARTEFSRLRSIHPDFIQHLKIEMEQSDAYAICGALVSGCTLLKSKLKVPAPIDTHNREVVTTITGGSILGPSIIYIPYSRAQFLGKNELIKSKQVYAFIFNSYLYIYTTDKSKLLIDHVLLSGVFSSPEEAFLFDCKTSNCFDWNGKYPVTAEAWSQSILPMTIDKLSISFQFQQDNNNDADPKDIIQQSNVKKRR